MYADIVNLRSFYATALGQMTQKAIFGALVQIWQPLSRERLVGLGYALPWLDRFSPDSECSMAFMPARQGAIHWPTYGPCSSALVFDEELPLRDSSIDRLLMVHLLEHSESPRETLHEAWRVLAPGGRLIIVVPNRRGLWTPFEHTPFGMGRPFSQMQLADLVREANFTPGKSMPALCFAPFRREFALSLATSFERFGKKCWPMFSGVIAMEAQKRLYQGLPVSERTSRRVFVPVLSPQGARVKIPKASPLKEQAAKGKLDKMF